MNLTRHLRPRLFAVAGVLLVALGVAWQHAGSASAYDDGSQPQDMEQFLTAVTKDVDAYWTQGLQGLRPARAAGQLRLDPRRPDRRERVR